ncbi:DLGAP1 (predicted) [Pycnogonum litorale]
MEKRNVPKKPDGLVPTSAKLVMQLSSSKDEQPEMKKKDGHYFLGIVDVERRKINDIVTMLENELSSGVIPEKACGEIRSAIGKATLLTTKKFSQFNKLCEKNFNQSSDEQFSTNSSDLEGFWDMVMLQVTDIHDTFRQIDKMRKNSWKEDAPSATNGISKPRRSTTALRGQSKSAPTTEKSAKAAAAAKARDEARKKLIEAKKKGRQNNSQKDNNVEIFMP